MGQLLGDRCPFLFCAAAHANCASAQPSSASRRVYASGLAYSPCDGRFGRRRVDRRRSKRDRDHSSGRERTLPGRYPHNTVFAADRPLAREVTAGNWTSVCDPCDKALVERVHSRRPQGLERLTPGPSLWCGPEQCPPNPTTGPTSRRLRLAQISAVSGARRQTPRPHEASRNQRHSGRA